MNRVLSIFTVCISLNVVNAQSFVKHMAQDKECLAGKEEARRESEEGNLGLYFFGLPAPRFNTYNTILMEEYGIVMKGGGDVVTRDGECYNEVMRDAIKDRFGHDVFEVVQIKVDSLYAKGLGDQEANFPGGITMLKKYLQDSMKWQQSQETVTGKSFVSFMVNEDGTISDAKIVKGLCDSCDQETIRLIENMPRWNPRIENGKKVKSRMTLPIDFSLK